MPSLMRFLSVVGALAAIAFASVYALATFVTPSTRDIVVTIPAQRLKAQQTEAAAPNPKTAGADTGSTPAAQ